MARASFQKKFWSVTILPVTKKKASFKAFIYFLSTSWDKKTAMNGRPYI
jgi:hypothetical protein